MSDVSRLAGIKWMLDTNRPVPYLDVVWLVERLESFEEWHWKEIAAANHAYLRAHPREVLHDPSID